MIKSSLAIGLAVALVPGAVLAQTPTPKLPSMCVCKSSDPNAYATHYAAIKTDGRDFEALRARLAEIDFRPIGRTIAVPSLCPVQKVCTDQDKLPVDDANLEIKILGYVADDGLVVDDRIQPDKFQRGAFLVLSGRVE